MVPYLSIRAKRWRMASETDIHRRLYLRHAKMVFTDEEQTTHAIQLDMSLAPFSFATRCCCVEKRQKFTECFLLFNHSRHCHGGGSSVNLITDFSTFRGGANWQVKFCTFLHGASRRSHSLLLGAFGAMAPTSKKFKVGMWIKVIQMQVLSLGIRVNLR